MGYNQTGGQNGQVSGYLGPAGDIGGALDFRIVPGFMLGAQIAYNTVTVPSQAFLSSAKWVNFGLAATFHIGEPRPRPVYVRRYY